MRGSSSNDDHYDIFNGSSCAISSTYYTPSHHQHTGTTSTSTGSCGGGYSYSASSNSTNAINRGNDNDNQPARCFVPDVICKNFDPKNGGSRV